jgi:NAD(P)H-dependent flavin oxidoreductase YrpB (nitropropane dioxygenase family)
VLRTPMVEKLEAALPVVGFPRAVANAARFRRISGLSWYQMLDEGRAMRKNGDLTWSQVLMAANTPMLLKAAMVDGNPDGGVMASGQVVGVIDDLPSAKDVVERIMSEAEEVLARLR